MYQYLTVLRQYGSKTIATNNFNFKNSATELQNYSIPSKKKIVCVKFPQKVATNTLQYNFKSP